MSDRPERGGDPAPSPQGELSVPPPTMTARLASAVLLLEAFAVFFGTLVAAALLPSAGVGRGPVWSLGLALAVVCVLASGTARRPRGVALGTAVQVLLVLTGVVVSVVAAEAGLATLVVGVGFAALWWWLVSVGRRIDRDRRRWAAQLAAQQ